MTINFDTKILKINSWLILQLPKDISEKLPSRGIVAIKGTINNFVFTKVLEPDGKGGHWFRIDEKLQEAIKVDAGDTVVLVIESTNEWPEPEVPDDFTKALQEHSQEYSLWKIITPNAHWDWIRWIQSTKNPETRKKRIEVSISKLSKGMKRPCCFNRNMCCVPQVSHNGVLLDSI